MVNGAKLRKEVKRDGSERGELQQSMQVGLDWTMKEMYVVWRVGNQGDESE